MFKAKNQQPPPSIELAKMTLEFTNKGYKIQIRDVHGRRLWRVRPFYAYALLLSAYRDEAGTNPLLDVDPAQLLAEEGSKIRVEGVFPQMQILWQQARLKYCLSRDESLRNICHIVDREWYFYACDKRFPQQWCDDAFAELTAGKDWGEDSFQSEAS